jgi:hypothetical protein
MILHGEPSVGQGLNAGDSSGSGVGSGGGDSPSGAGGSSLSGAGVSSPPAAPSLPFSADGGGFSRGTDPGGDSAAAPGGVFEGVGVSAGATGVGLAAGGVMFDGAEGLPVEPGSGAVLESSPPQAPLAAASTAIAVTDRNLEPSPRIRSPPLMAMAARLIHPLPMSLCVTLFFTRILQG